MSNQTFDLTLNPEVESVEDLGTVFVEPWTMECESCEAPTLFDSMKDAFPQCEDCTTYASFEAEVWEEFNQH